MENKRRVLVTGAGGFLGQHIVAAMASQGWRVVGLDCHPMADLEALQRQVMEWHTVTLPSADLDQILARLQPDLLIHAAGPASVSASVSVPYTDFDGSLPVFFQVLDAVRRLVPECKVIFLSSAAVYGNPPHLPISEDAPLRPISPYGYHKLLCEKLAEEFHAVYGVRTCAVRIFSAYGPGLRRQVLWDICMKALESNRLELLGTGDESRDFVHAQDVAQGIALIADRAPFQADVYNLATGKETKIRDLTEILIAALRRDVEVEFTGTLRAGDPLRWCADIARLSKLGYRPQTPIAIGAADYARWVLENKASFGE